MDPKFQALFFSLAILLFVLEGVGYRPSNTTVKPQFGWLGLALFAAPFLYAALVAGW